MLGVIRGSSQRLKRRLGSIRPLKRLRSRRASASCGKALEFRYERTSNRMPVIVEEACFSDGFRLARILGNEHAGGHAEKTAKVP